MKKIALFLTLIINFSLFSNNLHPNFNIQNYEIRAIVNNESPDVKSKILNDPKLFLTYIEKILIDESIDLTLVDKKNRLDRDYKCEDMVNLSDYNLNTRYRTMLFCRIAVDDFINMSEAAYNDGVDLFIASTYRSYEFQEKIFKNMKNYHGEEKAATIVAYPGASQHQLGLGVDFGSITHSYANTKAGQWLLENSWKFGFTLSYPEGLEHLTTYIWEPWHYRYIGHSATYIQRNYFNDIQHLFLLFWHKYKLFFKERHIQ